MAFCMYAPGASRRGCACSIAETGPYANERDQAPIIMPAPCSTGYIRPRDLIRPNKSSSALTLPGIMSRPPGNRTVSLNNINDKDRFRDKKRDDKEANMILVQTASSSKDRDGGQEANVQIYNLAGSNLEKELTKLLNIDTPRSDATRSDKTRGEVKIRDVEHFSPSGIYGLTTAMRLTSSLTHLREILQMYRDYDYCSRSTIPHPHLPSTPY